MKPFRLVDRIKSFRYAFAGLWFVLRSQHNAWIHLVATVFVTALGFFLGITHMDWCWLVIAIVLVWGAEAFNTAIESLADALHPEEHPLIGQAKDVAAGAVLVFAIGALVIGLLVFIPYFS